MNCFFIKQMPFNLALIFVAFFVFKTAHPSDDVKFEKTQIKIGQHKIKVELAKSRKQQERGLMYRKSLSANEGMLFIYPKERVLSFWMKNTFIPLSIGFFDKDRKFIESKEMKASNSVLQLTVDSVRSSMPAMYALEMNPNWFKENDIRTGQKFEFIGSITDHSPAKPSP